MGIGYYSERHALVAQVGVVAEDVVSEWDGRVQHHQNTGRHEELRVRRKIAEVVDGDGLSASLHRVRFVTGPMKSINHKFYQNCSHISLGSLVFKTFYWVFAWLDVVVLFFTVSYKVQQNLNCFFFNCAEFTIYENPNFLSLVDSTAIFFSWLCVLGTHSLGWLATADN